MAGTLFSVVLLLTPHSADAAQHIGSFVEPNILVGAASACQTLYDRSWRKMVVPERQLFDPSVWTGRAVQAECE
jgi:hypothetical protein